MSETIWQAVVLVVALLAGLNAILLVAVMRQVGTISLQIGPPRSGELDDGPDAGELLKVPELARERPTLLMFLSPGCPGCDSLLPAIPNAMKAYPELSFVAAITYGDQSERAAYARKIAGVVRRDLDDLHQRLRIPGTPFVIALDVEHRVVKAGVANNLAHLESLADALLAHNPDEQAHLSNGNADESDDVVEIELITTGGAE